MAAILVACLPADALKRLAAWLEPYAIVALNAACNTPSGICHLVASPFIADSGKVLSALEQSLMSVGEKRNIENPTWPACLH